MKYIYPFVNYPIDKDLLKKLNHKASLLQNKLEQLRLEEIGISEYNQRYLAWKIKNSQKELSIYAYLLALSLSETKNLNDMIIVDYGGGSGMLSFLSKLLGVGRVIYCDIYDVSCKDVKILAPYLDVKIDDIVSGDMSDLINYVDNNKINVDALISHNVIEHVYDLKKFSEQMQKLSGNLVSFIHATGVNEKNPFSRHYFKKIQKKYEYQDRQKEWGYKQRDTLKGFLGIRYEIISNYTSNLNMQEIKNLAILTRGLHKKDIEGSVDEYLKYGKISFHQNHSTNTCDPLTGNRTENLISPERLQKIFRKNFSSVNVLPGYHHSNNFIFFNIFIIVINFFIKILNQNALFFAPYVIYNFSKRAL